MHSLATDWFFKFFRSKKSALERADYLLPVSYTKIKIKNTDK
ncbi:MAG: hypothetical protein ACI97N_002711 [Cognaticolwellia sp.]|jgi:hypothetical protein